MSRVGAVVASLLLACVVNIDVRRLDAAVPADVVVPPGRGRITVDGHLDEPAWRLAATFDDFLQREPRDGSAPSERTEVLLLHDANALYLGIRCHDRSPGRVLGRVMEHDNMAITQDDQVVISIDAFHDRRNGYFFSTNPLGAKVEAQFADEGADFNKSWDGAWTVRTTRDAEGWTAEIEIPFSTIGHAQAADVVMGVNVMRRIARVNEIDYSPAMPRDFGGGSMTMSRARVVHLGAIESRGSVSIWPYVLGGVVPAGPRATYETRRAAGVDARWTARPDLAVDLTANPDFAEVESDDVLINLTRQSLFVPEKRPFFLENARMFQAGIAGEIQPFFSRRIGLAGDRPATVDGGVRLTGKVGGFEVGAFDMRTRANGSTGAANDAVIRVRHGVGKRSAIGLIATDHATTGRANRLFGADASLVGRGEMRLDVAAFTTSDPREGRGTAWFASASRQSEKLAFDWTVSSVDDRFDPALGFVARPAVRQARGHVGAGVFVQHHGIRRIGIDPSFSYAESISGHLETRREDLSLDCLLETEDRVAISVSTDTEQTPRPLTFIDTFRVERGTYNFSNAEGSFHSSPVRPVSGDVAIGRGGFYGADRDYLRLGVLLKVGHHVVTSADYERTILRSSNALASSSGTGGGPTDVAADLYHVRVRVMFSTRITLSGLAQYSSVTHAFDGNARLEVLDLKAGRLYVVINETRPGTTPGITNPTGFTHGIVVRYTWLLKR